jgi:Response regulator containing a CheY-like receiver domain and an HTH DNA-binding domain
MQIHIMVFIYNFSVFFGLCSIGLSLLMKYEDKSSFLNKLRNFIVSLFIYGFFNLVLYYKLHIIKLYNIESFFSITLNITFILIYYYWILFIHSLIPAKGQAGMRIFKVLCLLCAVVWNIDSLFFVDMFYNIQIKWGNYFSTLLEILMFFTVISLNTKYLAAIFKRNVLKKEQKIILIQSILNIAYFAYMLVKDIRISFFSFNTEMWSRHWISISSLFCLMTNVLIIILLCFTLVERIDKRKEALSDSEKQNINLEEIGSKYLLSKRETEVFRLILKGYSNPDISELLFISNNTLKKHINSIFKKMNVKSRLELIHSVNYPDSEHNK